MLTKTRIPAGDYVINPYTGCPHKCLYCYANYMRRFTGHSENWGDFIDIKRCDNKIDLQNTAGKKIIFCSVTDAYNPYERKYEITRNILKQFVDTEQQIEVLTKSALITRDIEIFRRIPNFRAGISLSTLDDTLRKKLEPRASPINERINAIKILRDAGIETYVFLSPILPGITDFREILSECKNSASMFYFENLNLRGEYRATMLNFIKEYYPELARLYRAVYTNNNMEYWKLVEADIEDFCKKEKIKWGSYFYHEKIRK